MKVGIVTIYDNTNIGNRLQNYALQMILLKYADSVITIRNKPFSNSKLERIKIKLNIGDSILINKLFKNHRKARFLEFNKKYINISNRCYFYNQDYQYKIENCDLYCAGSDQIWNPELKITGKLHFLNFSPSNCNFSYAASFGMDDIEKKYVGEIQDGLKHIKRISVREESGKDIIKKLTGRTDVETLIDPTLYLTASEWNKISLKPNVLIEKKYAVLYFLGDMEEKRRKEIFKATDKQGLDVIDLLDKDSPYYDIGPSEFLYLINNASLVCTDSFHASVFSFIFEVPLAIFPRTGSRSAMNGRLVNFTEKFNIQKCMMNDNVISEDVWKIDYSHGKEILCAERKKADAYLRSIFQVDS